MLLTLQFPLCDLRPFTAPRARLSRPHWPTPDPGSEFIRFFGQVRERKAREVSCWDEHTFCRATQALKFNDLRREFRIVFRRLSSDGRAVIRFEVGISIARRNATRGELLQVIADVLDVLCTPRGALKAKPLIAAGKDIANLYAEATHRKGEANALSSVIAGRPCLVMEYGSNEIAELPMSIDYQRPQQGLAFSRLTHRGFDVNTWYVDSQMPKARILRLVLLRLHAEHQALKYVLRAIDDGRIALVRGTASSDDTQAFLADTVGTLAKGERFAVPQKELLEVVHTYEDLCGKDEIQLLAQRVEGIRRQTKQAVLEQVERSVTLQPPPEVRVGPKFEWHGPIDELDYHSFFSRTRSMSVPAQWVSEVVKKLCPAVCLIRLPSRDRRATGFLIGKDLLLTNYHVVGGELDDEDVASNVADMRLTFELSPDPQREFRMAGLDSALPLSKVKEHDFALLRMGENIQSALQISLIVYDGQAVPERRKGIYILQHPQGGPLRVAGDADGVTGVYPDSGVVQYVSQAEHGSSGGPCFDEDLRLVAIHHAEVERPFGSVREGILFETIYPFIQKFV